MKAIFIRVLIFFIIGIIPLSGWCQLDSLRNALAFASSATQAIDIKNEIAFLLINSDIEQAKLNARKNLEEAIDLALELQPDIITLDNILPDMIGTDILKVYQEEELPSQVVMISAVGQESVIEEGLQLGAKEYIVKPFTSEKLIEVLGKL